MVRDFLKFEPYDNREGEWQAIIKTDKGLVSVRFSENVRNPLFTSEDKPYEVWYPDRDAPTPEQDLNDILENIPRNL